MKKITLGGSLLLFGIPSLYFFILTRFGIPHLKNDLSIHPALSWFIVGYLVFIPLFILAICLAKRESARMDLLELLQRLRIRKLSKRDCCWTLISMALISGLTGIVMVGSKILANRFGFPTLHTMPEFMCFSPLIGKERLFLLIWLPVFFFNIVGEEILWRGYILPRQELSLGKWAWLVNAMLWMVFHLCFGLDLLIILLPTLLLIPYTAQKTQNTLVGVITHALLNGPMFIMIALGLLG